MDGIVPIRQNNKWYISVTYCDGLGFALFDTDGNMAWELTGDHYEYLVGGYPNKDAILKGGNPGSGGGGGGGKPPTNKKASEIGMNEKLDYINAHGNEAYEELVNAEG